MEIQTKVPKEQPESWARFESGMRNILTVSKAEILRREAEYKKLADANPKKRGPKKTAK